MSSPVHHPKDLDTALTYAPPWAREEAQAPPLVPDPARSEASRRTRAVTDEEPPTFSGDRAVIELQRQLALDPEMVPVPPQLVKADRSGAMVVLRMCGVAGVAALIAGIAVSLPAIRLSWDQAGDSNSAATKISISRDKQDQLPTAKAADRGAANEPLPTAIDQGGYQTLAAAASAPEPAPPSTPTGVALRLDDAEMTTLLRRGQDFLNNGDLVSARLLLRRAADGGSATAALLLGQTFDPLVIQKLGAVGVTPDAAKAREWYQRAEELGSDIASQQLAKLAQSR